MVTTDPLTMGPQNTQTFTTFTLKGKYIYIYIYCHVYECGSGRGSGLDIGFIDHFNTKLVITINYNAIANFRTLQFA
jgi:hypothetical protein